MIAEEEYLYFLIKHGLTQEQYLCLHLIYKNRKDLIELYKDHFAIPNQKGMIPKVLVRDLKDKGFLVEKLAHGKKVVKLGSKFLDIFVDKHIATEEVYDKYPSYIDNQGINIPLTTMDRNVFANIYEAATMGSREEHIEILKDIDFAKENNLLNIGLEKFVKSKYWKSIREQRIKDISTDGSDLIQEHDF